MKKLLLVGLLAGVAAYICSPYYTAKKFEQALREADQTELERIVDFDAVRASLKAQIKSRSETDGATVPTKTVHFGGSVVDRMVDIAVTPGALVKVLKLEANLKSRPTYELKGKTWASPVEFTATARDCSKLRFRFAGLSGWRLVSIELGDELARHTSLSNLPSPVSR